VTSEKTAKTEAKRIEKQKETEEKAKEEVKEEKVVEKPKKKEEKKDKVLEEKIVTIGLRRIMDSRRTKRASRAMKLIREKTKRIAKKPVKLDLKLNEKVWARGIQKPPNKIKVKIRIKEESADVLLA